MSSQIMTASLTIIGGVIIFAFTQLILKYLIEPLHELTKVIGEVAFGLIFYAKYYGNPGLTHAAAEESSITFRQYACRLFSATLAVRWYWLANKLGLIPPKKDVHEAFRRLMILSNSFHQGDGEKNTQNASKIGELLGLEEGDISGVPDFPEK